MYFWHVNTDSDYMKRCLQLALHGMGNVSPNPMVGCIIVNNNRIIGEGYHEVYGQAHAEVNAIQSVKDKSELKSSTLYVNLEPCCHHGKTPPCADLIISSGIPKVVCGMTDPSEKVAGKGIRKMREAGIDVKENVINAECRELNKRFITFNRLKRPYIILKWAQTTDGYIDLKRKKGEKAHINWITHDKLKMLVHKWRTEEDAVIVGTHTAINDNPRLNVRDWSGENPVRIVIDEHLILPHKLYLFDQTQRTIVFTSGNGVNQHNIDFIKIDFSFDTLTQVMGKLYALNIQSIIVEGGKELLESFIKMSLWDEARVFTGNKEFKEGLKAPHISGKIISSENFGKDILAKYVNNGNKPVL